METNEIEQDPAYLALQGKLKYYREMKEKINNALSDFRKQMKQLKENAGLLSSSETEIESQKNINGFQEALIEYEQELNQRSESEFTMEKIRTDLLEIIAKLKEKKH